MNRLHSCLLLTALAALACVGPRPATPPSPHVGTAAMWKDFLALPPARSIALAGDPERIWVGAAVGNAPSQEAADAAAMKECKRRRRMGRMQDPCAIYARGELVVWGERRRRPALSR